MLRLYYPVRPFSINQRWGDNLPCVRDFGLPTQSIITGPDNFTCPMGYDKLYPHFGMEGHNGTDLAANVQNVYAACDGIVVEKQTVPARGLGVGILTNEQYDFGAFGTHFLKLRYWHLKSFYCEVGDTIEAGDLIGVSNSTGFSSGNHLHFEGLLQDKDTGGHPFIPNLPNSIAGTIDLQPYFTGIYADTIQQQIVLTKKLIEVLTSIINYLKK